MIELNVGGMTCGHCVDTVTAAVKALDVEASVNWLDGLQARTDSASGRRREPALALN